MGTNKLAMQAGKGWSCRTWPPGHLFFSGGFWRWVSQPPVALPVTPSLSLSHPLRACHIFLHWCFKPPVIFFSSQKLWAARVLQLVSRPDWKSQWSHQWSAPPCWDDSYMPGTNDWRNQSVTEQCDSGVLSLTKLKHSTRFQHLTLIQIKCIHSRRIPPFKQVHEWILTKAASHGGSKPLGSRSSEGNEVIWKWRSSRCCLDLGWSGWCGGDSSTVMARVLGS